MKLVFTLLCTKIQAATVYDFARLTSQPSHNAHYRHAPAHCFKALRFSFLLFFFSPRSVVGELHSFTALRAPWAKVRAPAEMLFSSFLFGSYLALVCSAYSWDTLSRTSLQMTMTMTLLFAYGSAMASPDYAHSNFVDSPSLFARDACSGNSNGQGSSNSTCVPSSTTCCTACLHCLDES